MKQTANAVLVLVTAPDLDTARALARAALGDHLAACANLIPKIESHYWWKDKIEHGTEVLMLLKTTTDRVHNHHNFAWQEEHDGQRFWVVRKGATPAFPGQKGFVGGSMGDDAVIIEGIDSPISREALFSTVHGAGRIMSRTAAKGKFVKVNGKRIRTEGLVRHDEMMKWIAEKGVILRGGDLDEAPQAYRRLPDVLAAHAGTIRILHTLTPLGVAMAGRDIVDPYKD